MYRPDGIKLLALWHFAMAGFYFVATFVLQGVLIWLALDSDMGRRGDPSSGELLLILGVSILLFLIGLSIAIVGHGVWKMRSWSRIPALFIAILCLPDIPMGTVAGGLTLWYLLRTEGGGQVLLGESPISAGQGSGALAAS